MARAGVSGSDHYSARADGGDSPPFTRHSPPDQRHLRQPAADGFAMESQVATLEMLDEVTADMRLDYPGRRPFRSDPSYPQRVMRATEIPFRAD